MGRRRRRRLTLRAAAAGAGALAGSYLAVTSGRVAPLDRRAAVLAARSYGPTADRLIGAATDLASLYGVAGLSGVLAASGRRRLAVDVAASGLLAWGVAQAAKPLLPRERPYQVDGAARLVAPPAGTSWPSGHAAVSAAMAATLAPELSPAGRMAVRTVAAGVGVSRLYVGVHHLSDVVGGYGVGTLAAVAWRLVRPRSFDEPGSPCGRRRRAHAGASPASGITLR